MEKNYLEISARTVDEAIEEALRKMGVTRDEVEITVLKKGRSGILGLGTEEAVVAVQRIRPEETHPGPADAAQTASVGTEIIQEALRLIGLQATVKAMPAESPEEPLSFDIEGDDLGILIGRRGQTLAAFQFLVRLMVAHRLQSWVPLTVDVEEYKKRRIASLRALALRMADQVKRTRRSLSMEPMPADERRIVHLTLAEDTDVTTQSSGEGEERKVTITLKTK